MYRLDVPPHLVEMQSESDLGFDQFMVLKSEVREWLKAHAGTFGENWNWGFKNGRDHVYIVESQVQHQTEILFDNLETSLLFKLTWGGNI